MKRETIYTHWKNRRRQIPVPKDFAAAVMATIEHRAPKEESELPAGLTEFPNRLLQWSAAAGLVFLGLFRIFYIAANLLRTNLLMPY